MSEIENFIKSLGAKQSGNGYEIVLMDGDWWLKHKELGNAEPLEQALEEYFKPLENQIKTLSEALKLYADESNWDNENGDIFYTTGFEPAQEAIKKCGLG